MHSGSIGIPRSIGLGREQHLVPDPSTPLLREAIAQRRAFPVDLLCAGSGCCPRSIATAGNAAQIPLSEIDGAAPRVEEGTNHRCLVLLLPTRREEKNLALAARRSMDSGERWWVAALWEKRDYGRLGLGALEFHWIPMACLLPHNPHPCSRTRQQWAQSCRRSTSTPWCSTRRWSPSPSTRSFAYLHCNVFGRNKKLNLLLRRGQIDSLYCLNYTGPWTDDENKRTSRTFMVQKSWTPGTLNHGGDHPNHGSITIGHVIAGIEYLRPLRSKWSGTLELIFQLIYQLSA